MAEQPLGVELEEESDGRWLAEVVELPGVLAYEATRATAFATGQQAHRLPRWTRRMLSLHKYHWEDNRAYVPR